jgi:hypothetical protein
MAQQAPSTHATEYKWRIEELSLNAIAISVNPRKDKGVGL